MSHYLITGATGYVGSMLIKELYKLSKENSVPVEITAIVRDRERAGRILPPEVRLVMADVTDANAMECIEGAFEYIIHCAAITASAYMISNPVETADGIVLGTKNVLELARRQQVKSMVYISSMEVYGNVPDIGRPRREEELGEIRLDNVRSCYPLGKRMAEHYCHIYAQEYGVPVKIARLAQTFGRGVRVGDNRVYMQFAHSVVEKKDILLKTEGLSMGNYCAIEEAVEAILMILQKGADGEAYNVVNEASTMCIRDMAYLVAGQVAGGSITVRAEPESTEKTGYAPDTELRLSGEKLRALGWESVKGLVEMYQDVVSEIKKVTLGTSV